MTNLTIKKIGIVVTFILFNIITFPSFIFAQDTPEVKGFNILPELTEGEISDVNEKITQIGQSGGKVWDSYNKAASASGMTTSKQIASGIMNWDTIMNYLVFIVKFLSQLGLVVGTGFIMYAGYKYMLSVFNGGKTPTETIKNAIIGVLIVIFSYAIMRTLTSLIGIS